MPEPTTNAPPKAFVISRVFDAPRDLLWKCFTDPERMRQWWSPKGFTAQHATMELRVGGKYHYSLKAPDGTPMWGKLVYREIKEPERLVLITSFSDEAGGTTRHPFSPTWPLEMGTTFIFEDAPGGKSRFTVHWIPNNPRPEELKTFDESHAGMTQGWGGTLDQLEAYLTKTK